MAATATKAADGVNVGDITVVIAEAVQRQIRKIVQDACIACGLLVKRDTGSDSGSDTDSDPGSLWDGASQASDTDTRITDFSDDPEGECWLSSVNEYENQTELKFPKSRNAFMSISGEQSGTRTPWSSRIRESLKL